MGMGDRGLGPVFTPAPGAVSFHPYAAGQMLIMAAEGPFQPDDFKKGLWIRVARIVHQMFVDAGLFTGTLDDFLQALADYFNKLWQEYQDRMRGAGGIMSPPSFHDWLDDKFGGSVPIPFVPWTDWADLHKQARQIFSSWAATAPPGAGEPGTTLLALYNEIQEMISRFKTALSLLEIYRIRATELGDPMPAELKARLEGHDARTKALRGRIEQKIKEFNEAVDKARRR
jgi:hypothetical protein